MTRALWCRTLEGVAPATPRVGKIAVPENRGGRGLPPSKRNRGHLSSENAISGITQSWQDISLLVELPVDRGTVDRHFRVLTMYSFDAFRRSDQTHKPHACHTGFFQE